MKKLLMATAMTVLLTNAAQADVGVMFGIGYTFGGGGTSMTLKALSSDEEDKGVAAVGVSYYPFSANKFGLDVGAGYQFNDAAVIASWDFLQKGVQISGGWANTEDSDVTHAPAPAPIVPGP